MNFYKKTLLTVQNTAMRVKTKLCNLVSTLHRINK